MIEIESDDDELVGSHCVMRDCYETTNLSMLPNRSKTSWIDFIRRHLGKTGWVPTNQTAVCGDHYRSISKRLAQEKEGIGANRCSIAPKFAPSTYSKMNKNMIRGNKNKKANFVRQFDSNPITFKDFNKDYKQFHSNFTQPESKRGYSVDAKTGKMKKRGGPHDPYKGRELGDLPFTGPVIRTEDGEFHVLSTDLNLFDPTRIDFVEDPRVIEPDGSIDGGGEGIPLYPNTLPNLAKKSKSYASMTERSQAVQEENDYLRKQLATFKDRLKSIESEYNMFQKGLSTVFGSDQISYIRRRAIGEKEPRGVKWRAETVASAAKMRLEFSDVTYKALLKQGFPFPSLAYMRTFAYKLEQKSYQGEGCSSQGWTEARLTDESLREMDREISYEDRMHAENTTETRHGFNYRSIATSNEFDSLLPNWFTKINLDARKTLLFPEGAGGHRSSHVVQPSTYTTYTYKGNALKPVAKRPRKDLFDETSEQLDPNQQQQQQQPPKKVVKLVPCAPPADFFNNKNIKMKKVTGAQVKLVSMQPVKGEPVWASPPDPELKPSGKGEDDQQEQETQEESGTTTQEEVIVEAEAVTAVYEERTEEVDGEVAQDDQQEEVFDAGDVVETVVVVKEEG